MQQQLLAHRGMRFFVGGTLSDPKIGLKRGVVFDHSFEVVFENGQRIKFTDRRMNLLHKGKCATVVFHRGNFRYVLDDNSTLYPFGYEDEFDVL